MADLMRDHALDLARVIRRLDQARMDIDDLAARDEGVDRRIVEHHDLEIAGRQPRRLGQRRGHIVEQRFGFGVTQDRLRGGGLQRDQRGSGNRSNRAQETSSHQRAIARRG